MCFALQNVYISFRRSRKHRNYPLFIKLLEEEFFMVTQKDIDRINELARKSKSEGLTDEEKAEQKALRIKYIEGFKESLVGQLDSITVVNPDGSKHKLSKKEPRQ